MINLPGADTRVGPVPVQQSQDLPAECWPEPESPSSICPVLMLSHLSPSAVQSAVTESPATFALPGPR